MNSDVGFTGRPTRMRSRERSRLYAARRAATVETSALGEFAASCGRKTGSRPSVASKRARRPAGVIVQPSPARWHETHVRPFVPSDRKYGFAVSTAPVLDAVCARPALLETGESISSPDSDVDAVFAVGSLDCDALHATVKPRSAPTPVLRESFTGASFGGIVGVCSTSRHSRARKRE